LGNRDATTEARKISPGAGVFPQRLSGHVGGVSWLALFTQRRFFDVVNSESKLIVKRTCADQVDVGAYSTNIVDGLRTTMSCELRETALA
jgi:hypothetical protein